VEKVVYLLAGVPDAAAGDRLRDRLLGEVATSIQAVDGVRGLTVAVHDSAAAEAPSPAPGPAGEAVHVAEVSVWFDCYQFRGPVDELVGGCGHDVAAHLVVESLYADYERRDWAAGSRSPGVLTVAAIHRPAGLSDAQWLHAWHEVQSPASARLQPRTRYVRNRVVQALTPGAPVVDGIVDEAWPSAGHVADPDLFFNGGGDAAVVQAHLEEMMANVVACLDLDRLRSTTMSEYLVAPVP
jgi:hypothetical protein